MNHFFALALSEDAQQTVYKTAEKWRERGVLAKWYDPADYHITLKFLGDVGESEQAHLKEAAEPIAAMTPAFLVSPQPMGAFPSMDHPSVLWAGVGINPELDILRIRLDRAMTGLGFRADHRGYKPHVTVARCSPKAGSVEGCLLGERLFGSFTVDHFVLMQTLPPGASPNGTKARYNIVQVFPFGNRQLSDVS